MGHVVTDAQARAFLRRPSQEIEKSRNFSRRHHPLSPHCVPGI